MKMLKAVVLWLVLSAGAYAAVPVLPGDAVVKPTFMTGYDSFSGGTAFVCKVPRLDLVLLLSAHHLFGSACGLSREFSWNEIKPVFSVVTGVSMTNPQSFVSSSDVFEIPGALALSANGYDRDLSAWVLTDKNMECLELGVKQPKEGDHVYLYARERGAESLKMYEAIVVKSNSTEFEYKYILERELNLGGTSGAPIVDSDGLVVSVNLGGYQKEGKTTGIGTPLIAIMKALSKAKEYKTKGP